MLAGTLLFRAIKAGTWGSFYMHSDFCTAKPIQDDESTSVEGSLRKLPGWVLPRRQQHSYPDIFIVDILEQAIIGRQGKCFSRPQRGKHTITIIEIKYKYDL